MPNGQFCRCNLRRPSLYDSLRRACVAGRREDNAAHAGAQQFMLRGWPKTVESCRAGAPNRDNRHFGGA
ncbi:hypothetical protein FCJ57_03110 [Burkholderia diffusa]|nr:hypothetical protein [Burkholderia diffusa]